MNGRRPFFSVITPQHNSAAYMRKGLNSIRSQEFKDYELIIICDACTDNTSEIAMGYADKLLSTRFGCAGLARNAGLDIAAGEWVLWMDDDDWYLPGAFGIIAEELEKQKDIDILAYGFEWQHMGIAMQSPKKIYSAIWNKAWNREFIGADRFPDWFHSDDAGFARMMHPRARFGFLNMPLYHYEFMRPGSVSDRIRKGEYDNSKLPENIREVADGYERWLKSKEF